MNHDGSVCQTMLEQPIKVQARADYGRAAPSQAAPPPPVQTQRSPMTIPQQESLVLSHRGKASNYQSTSARDTANYEYYEPNSRARPHRSVKNASQNSPRDINESRVATDQDHLATRKARPVQYEPCKLSQYKKEKPDGYYELGNLQPDLNTDELVDMRAKKKRIKAFPQNLRAINKNAQTKKPAESRVEQGENSRPSECTQQLVL